MDEQPSNWELGRRLDEIGRNLGALVGRPEYSSDQRALEHRLSDLARDLEDVRRKHDDDVRMLDARITAEAKAAAERGQWKTTLLAGLIPSLVAVAAILVTIWLHGGG